MGRDSDKGEVVKRTWRSRGVKSMTESVKSSLKRSEMMNVKVFTSLLVTSRVFRYCRLALMFFIAIMLTGCGIHRITAIARVDDFGDSITTKYKYKFMMYKVGTPVDKTVRMEVPTMTNEDFKRILPGVFSDTGVPFSLGEKDIKIINSGDGISAVLGIFTVGILPIFRDSKYEMPFEVTLVDSKIKSEYNVEKRHDAVGTILSPFGLLLGAMFYDCPPKWDGTGHGYYDIWYMVGPNGYDTARDYDVIRKAIVYGVAARLKELEEAGRVCLMNSDTALPVKQMTSLDVPSSCPKATDEKSQRPHASANVEHIGSAVIPAYKIVSCKRDARNDFSYRFILELNGDDQCSLRTFRAIQKEFREAVKADYSESFPGVDVHSLRVDFSEYELDNRKITGRAVVLSISVASLTYDPNTRMGKLAVKVNANQYEEARKWIRKNIETLARDKNIALMTGQLPPAATYYSLGEKIDGNVIEIEFKTE